MLRPMSCYFIVNTQVKDMDLLNEYISGAVDTLGPFPTCELVVMDDECETIEGTPLGSRTVILKFDSKDDFHRWYKSDAYQAVIDKRFKATEGGFGVLAHGFAMPS